MKPRLYPCALLGCIALSSSLVFGELLSVQPPWFGIRVVDEATGRGVPLVELRTVNDIRCVTDNAGWIAFLEPGLMDREVFFHVSGPGIEREKDGFGFACARLVTTPGSSAEVKVKRLNIAERIGRITGQGLYRDSELLGLPHPLPNIAAPGVMGQDSAQAVLYRGRVFWLWGDTNVPHYQLGNYHTTCATTALDAKPEAGLAFEYFADPERPSKLRHMMPLKEHGAVWLFGLMSLKDEAGEERMFVGYSRQKGLVPPDEQGIAEFHDGEKRFKSVASIPKDERWRKPAGQAFRSGDHFYFSAPFAYVRVSATVSDITKHESYETFRFDEASGQWAWQKGQPPTTQEDEGKLLAEGKMKPEQARYQLTDAATGKPIKLHGGSIQRNAWRNTWLLIGTQFAGKEEPSVLGEVWYAESPSPDGPWRKAVKVASHPRYSYYNPIHQAFLDAEGGRVIYFEGTYSLEFSGNPLAPARYDYNQLMYRLDLADERLQAARF